MTNLTFCKLICLILMTAVLGCRQQSQSEDDDASSTQSEDPAGMDDPVAAKLALWTADLELAENAQDRHQTLMKVVKDESIPPYRALEFFRDQKLNNGTRIGGYVTIMTRVSENDPVAATRCFELIKNEDRVDSLLHSLGRKLGRRAPEHGLQWLNSLDYSRKVYFAAVNLGTGFAEYTSTRPLEEIEPLFDRFLVSPLFAGKAYNDKVKGEGSRMRERMTDGVLEALAREGRLDDALVSRLKLKVPPKCAPHLDSYQVYAWPLKQIKNEFQVENFPEESQSSATAVAHQRLLEKSSLDDVLEWSKRIKNPRLVSMVTNNTYSHFIRKADDDEVIEILKRTKDPRRFRAAMKWAKYTASNDRRSTLKEKMERFEKSRR